MAKLLLNFRGVPDDEIEEIRALLKENNIDFYETTPSHWAISAGGIWLSDNRRYQEARMLLDQYQARRSESAHAEYLKRKEEGRLPTLADKILENPARFIFYSVVIAVILYFSIKPFLDLGK